MLKNNAFILTLAYPETIVLHPVEWYSKLLRLIGIGNKKHVRAGHAALVLISKETGVLEYHDYGRYITTSPHGRVRGKATDFELLMPLKAYIENDTIVNLNAILKFLATQPKRTHGSGNLYASVCNAVDYTLAKNYITEQQNNGFTRYAAFIKNASNCARFVTDTLIQATTNATVKKKLIKSNKFTPSTLGNVANADTENHIYVVSDSGEMNTFNASVGRENRRLFFDVLKGYYPDLVGGIEPQHNETKAPHAQWLGGIGTGAWFEIYSIEKTPKMYRFRRVSPEGTVDCHGIYKMDGDGFNSKSDYRFLHHSNCAVFYIQQNEKIYKFEFYEDVLDEFQG